MNNTVLITGVNGFIGSSLYKSLNLDFDLYGLDIYSNGMVPENKFLFWNDLINIPQLDVIIHLAGKAHDTNSISEYNDYFNINVGLTKKIFQYFLESTATKFVFFSSVKAVVDSTNGVLLTENVTPNPKTPYGISKLEAEFYITNKVEKWRNELISNERKAETKLVYILRPCMIHGLGNKGNLNLLFRFQKMNLPWPLGAFDNKRSFCSIGNLIFIIKQLIDGNLEQGIYNIADDEPLSTNLIVKLMSKALNRKTKICIIPQRIIFIIAKLGDFLGLTFNSERLKKLTESYIVSNKKLLTALGLDILPYSAVDGMKETIKSFIINNPDYN